MMLLLVVLPSLLLFSSASFAPRSCCSLMTPEPTNLRRHLHCNDSGFLDFVSALLSLDPDRRPTAAQALKHPWLQEELPMEPYVLPA
jgi:serine/threonine protein kinase